MTLRREYVVTITCNDCGKTERDSNYYTLRSKGWRVAGEDIHYCPDCAKSHKNELKLRRRDIPIDMRRALDTMHNTEVVVGRANDFDSGVISGITASALIRRGFAFKDENGKLWTTDAGEALVSREVRSE